MEITLNHPITSRTEWHYGSMHLRAGLALDNEIFTSLKRRLMLEHCKWDAQMGDVQTLADFPLLLPAREWQILASFAEQLTAETLAAEEEVLQRPELLPHLGLPQKIYDAFASRRGPARTAARTMRFDFHPTTEGWRISEVNSDVPGGFTEASHFTRMMAAHFPELSPAGNPLEDWAKAIAQWGPHIALLTAPGFMEDHQIMACLADQLCELGCQSCLTSPLQIEWRSGRAFLKSHSTLESLDSLVRFYQGEWLANLPDGSDWHFFFSGAITPVANPGQGIIAESKRFPLLWNNMKTPLPTWRALLPETRDPRDAAWQSDDSWLLKSAFCNTGDTVSVRSMMSPRQWESTMRQVRRHPHSWVAQQRFEAVPIPTPPGHMFPCVGVYTIDGRAAGAYGRISPRPLINFEAIDVALLIEPDVKECHG